MASGDKRPGQLQSATGKVAGLACQKASLETGTALDTLAERGPRRAICEDRRGNFMAAEPL